MTSWPVKALSWPPSWRHLGEVADGDLVRRLEHQMLEEVRDAGDALGLIGGADLVPDHVRDDGGAVVGVTTTSMPLASVNSVARWAAMKLINSSVVIAEAFRSRPDQGGDTAKGR